jgi:hypothetical protein
MIYIFGRFVNGFEVFLPIRKRKAVFLFILFIPVSILLARLRKNGQDDIRSVCKDKALAAVVLEQTGDSGQHGGDIVRQQDAGAAVEVGGADVVNDQFSPVL